MQEITYTITPKGTISYTMEGFTGTECTDITNAIDSSLGSIINQGNTDDIYKQKINTQLEVHT